MITTKDHRAFQLVKMTIRINERVYLILHSWFAEESLSVKLPQLISGCITQLSYRPRKPRSYTP